MKAEIVVVGAGAIGLTTAYELARRGRGVVVIDRDRLRVTESTCCTTETPFRSASSWAACGILPPANLSAATDPLERLRGLSHQLFPDLASRLKGETGIDPQLERCGGWYLSDTAGETASLVGMVDFWRELNIQCEEVDAAEFAIREPAMAEWAASSEKARAWWAPDEYRICTPLYLQALITACKKLGVRFLDERRVVGIEESKSPVTVSVDDGECVTAEQLAVCGGVWSGLVSESLRLAGSLVPVRGQMLLLKTETPILSGIINFGQRYLVPRSDGAVLVGSCEEEVGFQHGTTPRHLQEFRDFARQVCPPLARARELGAWSGLRPLTYDGFPMCGKVPDGDRVFVAAGHFRSGIHLSPGTAVCLADLMCGTPPPIDVQAFAVGKQQQQIRTT